MRQLVEVDAIQMKIILDYTYVSFEAKRMWKEKEASRRVALESMSKKFGYADFNTLSGMAKKTSHTMMKTIRN